MGADNMDSSEEDSEDLEFRMYSMLHYADQNTDGLPTIIEIPEYSTNKYKKINTPKETPKTPTKPNEVKSGKTQDKLLSKNSGDDVILIGNTQSLQNTEVTKDASINKKRKYSEICKKSPKKHKKLIVKSIKNNPEIVNIDSSDDDQSIIEVELPDPQMPICINSSDDESTEAKSTPNKIQITEKPCVSPVPSNMSDDFIRGDCSDLNISAESNNSYAFNFGLHGVDLGDIQNFTKNNTKPGNSNALFATPNITSKKKKNNNQNYTVPEQNYVLPSTDVYESESSDFPDSVLDVPITNPFMKPETVSNEEKAINTDSLIMANVINADENVESENANEISQFIVLDETGYEDEPPSFTSINDSNINMSGKLYSVKQCLKDMDYYYNKNWGTDFDHIKLRKEMPRDKSHWKVNSNDLYRKPDRRNLKVCGFCNKKGHRDEFCSFKPIVCIYCGATGHKQFKCPKKLCLNCGSPSNFISNHCKNCDQYKRTQCDICKEPGHPKKHCPDQWRRYHQTTINEVPLNEVKEHQKSRNTLYCSGCAKKGHIINDCTNYKKFSEFRPSVPFICDYSPVYTPEGVKSLTPKTSIPSRSNTPDKNKALSKSPVTQHNKNDTNIIKLVTELNKSNNNNEQLHFENFQFTIKNDRVQEDISEIQNTSIASNDNYSPAIKKLKIEAKASDEYENVIHHLLSSKLFLKLNTITGRIFILDLSNRMSIKYFVRKEKSGGVLTLSGDMSNQGKFLAKMTELLHGKIIPDEQLPFLLKDNILPKNRIALIQRLTNDIILLNNNLGKPGKLFRKVATLTSQLKNKFPDRNFDSLDEKSKERFIELSMCCKYLNMILLGKMGKKKGHVYLKKLDENLSVLHDSTFDIVPFHQMKEIESNYFPIFSSKSLYNYENILYKTNNEMVSSSLHPRKPISKHIHSIPSKLSNKQLKALLVETKIKFHSLPECDQKVNNVYRLLLQNNAKLKKNKDESLKPLIVTQCNTILAKWDSMQS